MARFLMAKEQSTHFLFTADCDFLPSLNNATGRHAFIAFDGHLLGAWAMRWIGRPAGAKRTGSHP